MVPLYVLRANLSTIEMIELMEQDRKSSQLGGQGERSLIIALMSNFQAFVTLV